MSYKTLGIDPSLTRTGYCCLDGNELDTSFYGRGMGIIDAHKLRGTERLIYLEERLWNLITSNKFDLICIEGYSYGSKGRAVFDIGELGGILRLNLHKAKMPWIEIAPATLKKFVTGSGIAEKDMVTMNVMKKWGIECANNNEADAVSLAMIGYYLLNYMKGSNLVSNEKQVEVMDKLKPQLKQWQNQERMDI